jgi:hypothetical protein
MISFAQITGSVWGLLFTQDRSPQAVTRDLSGISVTGGIRQHPTC